MPAMAPGTSAASVGTSARSNSFVAMITLIMGTQPVARRFAYYINCGL